MVLPLISIPTMFSSQILYLKHLGEDLHGQSLDFIIDFPILQHNNAHIEPLAQFLHHVPPFIAHQIASEFPLCPFQCQQIDQLLVQNQMVQFHPWDLLEAREGVIDDLDD